MFDRVLSTPLEKHLGNIWGTSKTMLKLLLVSFLQSNTHKICLQGTDIPYFCLNIRELTHKFLFVLTSKNGRRKREKKKLKNGDNIEETSQEREKLQIEG